MSAGLAAALPAEKKTDAADSKASVLYWTKVWNKEGCGVTYTLWNLMGPETETPRAIVGFAKQQEQTLGAAQEAEWNGLGAQRVTQEKLQELRAAFSKPREGVSKPTAQSNSIDQEGCS